MKMNQARMAALGLIAMAGFACCGTTSSETSCATACADSCTKTIVYDASAKPIDITDMEIFFEADKAPVTQVTPTVTRKMIYLNDLMTTIVDIKGPMEVADPFHSHDAEQICYIAEGDVIVTIGDRSQKLGAGDMFAVPSGVPHTVQALGPRLLLIDSFNPIREDFLK